MRRVCIMACTIGLVGSLTAENYLINGGQESRINYRLVQRVDPADQTKTLRMSFVIPESFQSPTYNQRIENFNLELKPNPSQRKQEKDERGNRIIRATWNNPKTSVDVSMTFSAFNRTVLKPIESTAPFPVSGLPDGMDDYLAPSLQVQFEDPRIKAKARELVQGVKTEFDAVQRILTWIIDHMRYVTPPKQYDAVYAFENGKGNCQNYSHICAALMRAVGIPVRIVNGVTLKEPFTVRAGSEEFTFKMGQGRHSWVEVYLTDLGWVPFDPQQTELFVSNRFVRIEVGVDNEETINDGMIRWRQTSGAQGRPQFEEIIEADFPQDNVNLSFSRQDYGPKKMLLCPEVRATFKKAYIPPPPPPEKVPEDRLKQMQYRKAFLFGNLDFPRGVDFIFTRGPAKKGIRDEYEMRKNFLVETAEYVTTKLTQFAQVVVLEKPVRLAKVGLALHKFGGSGQLWIDLMEDKGGKPGRVIATTDWLTLDQLSPRPGYDWVDFEFETPQLLSPGKYWIGLGFTGSPIVNWFYTYGKPVGPVDGTRYKSVYETEWSGALAFEFNYRVAGWTTN